MPPSTSYPPLVTAVSSPSEGIVAVAHPQQDHQGASTSTAWRVGLYNVKNNGHGYLQTTLTANNSSSSSSSTHPAAISGRIQRLMFWGGDSASLLAAVSSRCVVVWDLRRGVVAHTIVPAKKSSAASATSYAIVDAQVAVPKSSSGGGGGGGGGSSEAASPTVNGRSLYLLVQHGDTTTGGDGDDDGDGNDDIEGKRSVLWQYDGSQLVRKIKIKGGRGTHLMVSPNAEALWVSCGRKIRIHSGETGKVLHKLSFSSHVRAMAPSHAPDDNGAYVLLESGEIRLCAGRGGNDDEFKTDRVVATTTAAALALCGASSSAMSLWPLLERCGSARRGSSSVDSILVGGRHLVRVSTTPDDEKDPSSPASPQPLVDMKTVDSGVVRCALGLAKGRDEAAVRLVAVLYKNGTVQIQSRAGHDDSALEAFGWRDADDAAAADRNSGKRQKTRDDKGVTHPAILGPAQAGGTARQLNESAAAMEIDDGGDDGAKSDDHDDGEEDGDTDSRPSKKSRPGDPQNDETIGTRLAQLRAQLLADEEEEERQDAIALSGGTMTAAGTGGDTVTFQPKKATTESLSQLLKQALQDEALLELCLAVSNPSIIRETVSQLSASDVSALVAAITSRVAFRPARAEVLCLWLTVLLQTRKASLEVLQPLQNLINDRIEILPALLKLEGRLSLLSP